jgi:orotidine-5'-phosphate decarboxylase
METKFTESAIREKIVVALDVNTRSEALTIVDQLKHRVGMFKIGSQLFSSEGPQLVREIVGNGEKVFLDLKYHDIPNTVAGAASAATRMGVSIFNVHASGGKEMMEAAARAATETASSEGIDRPIVLGVTVLTSIDSAILNTVGIDDSAETHVLRLAELAKESGLDGVVASTLEIRAIRKRISDDRFVLLIPGIRPGKQDDDQKRTSTPIEALRAGANYLVIGRPITEAPDPVYAVEEIIASAVG